MKIRTLFPVLTAAAVACGGGDAPATGGNGGAASSTPAATPAAPATPAPPTGPLTTPAWFQIDNTARTVHLAIIAGETPLNNHWNYNGTINGDLAITVPVGYTVTIDLHNADTNMAHSLGVLAQTSNFMTPPQPNPVFPGAITSNPTSMMDATMPGEDETVEFVASEAGTYSIVCLVPGHSAVGMWMYFIVSADGQAGVQTR